jgi:alcohol dehydrogenase, propanol-preferring
MSQLDRLINHQSFQSLGEEASTALEGSINKNEKVLIYPWIGEGLCPACRIGDENLCDKPRSLGIYVEGGYAEYVLESACQIYQSICCKD